MKTLLSILFTISIVVSDAQIPSFEWVRKIGSLNEDFVSSIATDASGNVYTIGSFQATVDFDPGTGTSNLTSAGADDIFIQKLDVNGNFLWAKKMGGIGIDAGISITIDASGNIYASGQFEGTAEFDPGTGTSNLTSVGDYDIFIQKLDANGNFLWVKQLGGIGYDLVSSITTNHAGYIYIAGSFEDTVDFDPGIGISNLISTGIDDIFVQKLDSNGDLIWVKQTGGTSSDRPTSIITDQLGNIYTTGTFYYTVDFDPGIGSSNLTSMGADDMFVQKLDSNGNFLWVKQMGGISFDRIEAIAIDNLGDVYTTGRFNTVIDFDPGPAISNLTPIGNWDIFVQKLDGNGNFLWVNQIGGSGNELGPSIATDPTGNVYVSGNFKATVDFDPGIGTNNLTSVGMADVFIQSLNPNGDLIWVRHFGGTATEYISSICIDDNGNIYSTGAFYWTVDFDPGTNTSNLTSAGGRDIFIQKLSQSTITDITERLLHDNLSIYPNPTSNQLTIDTELKISEITIIDITGKIIITTKENVKTINVADLSNGIYFIKIINEEGAITKKFVKQ